MKVHTIKFSMYNIFCVRSIFIFNFKNKNRSKKIYQIFQSYDNIQNNIKPTILTQFQQNWYLRIYIDSVDFFKHIKTLLQIHNKTKTC